MSIRLLDNPAVAHILEQADFASINRRVADAMESNHVSEPGGSFRQTVGRLIESMLAASFRSAGPVCSYTVANHLAGLGRSWISDLMRDESQRFRSKGGHPDMKAQIERIIGDTLDAASFNQVLNHPSVAAKSLALCASSKTDGMATIYSPFINGDSGPSENRLSLLIDITMVRAALAEGESYADLKASNYSLFSQLLKGGYPVGAAGAAALAKGIYTSQDNTGYMVHMPTELYAHLLP